VPSATHPRPASSGKIVSDTAVHTGSWARATVIGAANIAAISLPLHENGAGYTGTGLADGVEINGPITSIQLTSGKVRLDEIV
jgi:hypothetical protein